MAASTDYEFFFKITVKRYTKNETLLQNHAVNVIKNLKEEN